MLTDWQSLVPCLTAEITEGLPQVEIQDLATLTACCVEAAVSAEAQAGNHGDAAAAGALLTTYCLPPINQFPCSVFFVSAIGSVMVWRSTCDLHPAGVLCCVVLVLQR